MFLQLIEKDERYFLYLINRLIEFLKENEINCIRFFWWEPLVYLDKLIILIEILRKNWFNWQITVNTNLHINIAEYIDFFKRYNISFITSLNWRFDIHSKTRGTDYKIYKRILSNINLILNNQIDLQINFVFFPNDYINYDYYDNLNFIFDLWIKKINLLPLLYSKLLEKIDIDNYIQNIKNVVIRLVRNGWKERILNFSFLKRKANILPLFEDQLVLDYDWNFYSSMVILENYFEKYKDIMYLWNIETLDFVDLNVKIDYRLVYKILENKLWKIFINSIYVSNKFNNIFRQLKYI